MKNIIPAILATVSTLSACTNKPTESSLASKHKELGTVLNLPWPHKDTTADKNTVVFGDSMEADRKEEFQANGGIMDEDTITDAAADSIYYEEFIKPGPH